ncbi:MAG: tRNA (adenosine(37)-N6)-dimethylallyltransferase MiaA [Natronospirillum sp.]
MSRPVICLMGPTAAGKTGLGVALARALNGEVISVDSALVYRGMNIGTAKPLAEERQGVPHHLLDIIDPAERYSAEAFHADALACIQDLQARDKTPILVGGTMLYFRALLSPMATLPAADAALRSQLSQRAEAEGLPALHAALARIDPVAAAAIHPHNRQRLLRALEVYELTGRPISDLWQNDQPMLPAGDVCADFPWPVLQLAVRPERRADLHARIAQRFDQMLSQGFADEVAALRARGDLSLDHTPAMRCVGYRQMWQHLAGEVDWETMRAQGLAATRQLAKRQLTWLRGWRNLTAFDTLSAGLTERVLNYIEHTIEGGAVARAQPND